MGPLLDAAAPAGHVVFIQPGLTVTGLFVGDIGQHRTTKWVGGRPRVHHNRSERGEASVRPSAWQAVIESQVRVLLNFLSGLGLVSAQMLHQGTAVRLVRLWNPWGKGEWKGDWSDG